MATTFEPGTVLADKYRVVSVLGEGGMGVVLEALQLELDRRVAIKLMLSTDPELRAESLERFRREAKAAARLGGDHVTRVYDIGQLDGETPYIVMEYLDGQDLRSMLKDRGPLPIAEAVTYVLQACEGLAEAHAAGIVHRDIKPGNLFVARRPDGRRVVKIVDFGISKVEASSDVSVTKTGGAIGSPLYISPEQFASAKKVTHATDIWALGTVLAELLTGEPVFAASSIPEVYSRIMMDPMPDIIAKRPDVKPELQQVLHRCLERQPADRYRTVADLAMALEPFAPTNAVGHVAAAVRIIQGSDLAHGALPEVKASVHPPPRVAIPSQPGAATTVPHAEALGTKETELAASGSASIGISVDPTSIQGAATGAGWAHDTAGSSRRRRRNLIIAVAMLAVVGAAAVFVMRSMSADAAHAHVDPEPSASAVSAPAVPPSASAPKVEVEIASAAPPPSASPEPPPSASAKVEPKPAPAHAPTAKPAAKPKPKPAGSAKSDDLLLYRR